MLSIVNRSSERGAKVEPTTGLPLYLRPNSVVWKRERYNYLASSAGNTALRWIRLSANGFQTLKSALETSDQMFDTIANYCGARVPAHTWGLAKPPFIFTRPNVYDDYYRFSHPLLPRGLQVVADTEVIRNISPPVDDTALAINDGLKRYNYSNPRLQWVDEGTRQFRLGESAITGEKALWLLDFEPFVRKIEPEQSAYMHLGS